MKHIDTRRMGFALLPLMLTIFGGIYATTGLTAQQQFGAARGPRVENIDSAPAGLPDQTFDRVTFDKPLTTSLITVANRGGTGNRSFLVVATVVGGGTFSFQAKENGDDITLSLTDPIPIAGISVRCDSFSDVPCRYSVSLVGR